MPDEHKRPPLPMVSAILQNSSHRFAEALCGAVGRCPALSALSTAPARNHRCQRSLRACASQRPARPMSIKCPPLLGFRRSPILHFFAAIEKSQIFLCDRKEFYVFRHPQGENYSFGAPCSRPPLAAVVAGMRHFSARASFARAPQNPFSNVYSSTFLDMRTQERIQFYVSRQR